MRLPPATIRTQVLLPLRFPDGYTSLARVFSFDGLADGREHICDRRGAASASTRSSTPTRRVTVTERVPTGLHLSDTNARYLATKALRGGHTLDVPPPAC